VRTSWERATIGLSLHHQQQRALCCSHLRLEAHHRIVHLHAHSRCKAQPRRCPSVGRSGTAPHLRMWSSGQARQAGQRTTRATVKAPRLVLEGDLLARLLGLVAHQGLGFRAHSPELPATACVHAYARATLNRPCEARSAGAACAQSTALPYSTALGGTPPAAAEAACAGSGAAACARIGAGAGAGVAHSVVC
jgi:hypothetical protein